MHAKSGVVVALVVLLGPLSGQMQLTLTDGTTTRGSFAGIAADGAWTWQGAGGALKLPAAKIVSLEAPDGAQAPMDDAFRIELSSGDSLIGRIEDGSADDLRLRAPAFGDITVPLDEIAAIWNLQIPRVPESLSPAQGDAETLYLDRDGRIDPLPGRLERIGKNQLTFSSSSFKDKEKRAFSFARDRIVAIKMAGSGRKADPKGGATIIRLKDGSRLSGTLGPSDGASFAIKLTVGLPMVVDARFVKSLALVNAALRYLSDLEPSKFVETPLMSGALLQGLHKDRGLKSGQPLRIGRRTFSKGLLVPARSRVTWPLDGTFGRFTATVGVDGGIDGGDLAGSVKATILVDGKPLWTGAMLKGGQPPENVDVSGLSGGRELAIEVDFADSYDGGARAVFGNAMLVR